MTRPRRFQSRAGFTLTELLVAITVLAILAGFLAPAVLRAFKGAKEATVIFEMKQLDMAMESFKNKYGFYPPSFESDGATVGVFSASGLARYVSRISPNHAENTSSGVGSGTANDGRRTRLEHWWAEVGQYLDQESSLVFWLCGVCKNKQYPITGGLTSAVTFPPLAAHSFNYDSDGIERDVLFEFDKTQLIGKIGDVEVVQDKGVNIPTNQIGFILEYRQAHGGQEGEEVSITTDPGPPKKVVTEATDFRFKYRDAATYNIGGGNLAYYEGPSNGDPLPSGFSFANANSYQLITFGMDGLGGAPGNWNAIDRGEVKAIVGGPNYFGGWGTDNICNFADGRLQKWVIENE